MTNQQLEALLRKWSKSYYSGKPLVDDAKFDRALEQLRSQDPDNKFLAEVRTPVIKNKKPVKYRVPMPSLDKANSENKALAKFVKTNRGPYWVMPKKDGTSVYVEYENGIPVSAASGGDAKVGADISSLIPHLNIPKKIPHKGILGIRFEAIIPKSKFKKSWSAKYANARNLAAGVVNKTKGIHEAVKDVDLVALSVVYPKCSLDLLDKLDAWGFHTVERTQVKAVSETSLEKILANYEKKDHEIDGLVVTQSGDQKLTYANPSWSIAFKRPADDNYAVTTVTKVEWNASKHGELRPRVFVEPVKLRGVTVTKASAFNAKYIVANKIGPGTQVSLMRSGDVIPDIQEVIKPTKAQLPDLPKSSYAWDENKTHFVLTVQSDVTDSKKLHALLADGLGIEFFGPVMLSKFHKAGFSVEDILRCTDASEFTAVPGVLIGTAQKLFKQVQYYTKRADLAKVAANSGFFGKLMGSTRIQTILDSLPKTKDPFDKLVKLEEMPNPKDYVANLTGFNVKTATAFCNGLSDFLDWVESLDFTFIYPKVVAVKGNSMQNQVVVFTGIRDKSAEAKIAEQGGNIGSTVNKDTTLLVVKDLNSGSAKMVKAQQLGVKVVSIDQLYKMLGM